MPSKSLFVFTHFSVQLKNDLQPPQWGAPVVVSGLHVVLDDQGKQMFNPAHVARPIGGDDLTPETMEAINSQLLTVGLRLSKVGE